MKRQVTITLQIHTPCNITAWISMVSIAYFLQHFPPNRTFPFIPFLRATKTPNKIKDF